MGRIQRKMQMGASSDADQQSNGWSREQSPKQNKNHSKGEASAKHTCIMFTSFDVIFPKINFHYINFGLKLVSCWE